MVIVVQPFAHRGERQPLQVRRFIRIRPTTEVVTDCVHRRGTREVQVDVSECREKTDSRTEHDDECDDAESEARLVVPEKDFVPLVVRQILRVLVDDCRVAQRLPIQRDVPDLHLPPTEEHW